MALTAKEKNQIRKVVAYRSGNRSLEILMKDFAAMTDEQAKEEIAKWKAEREAQVQAIQT